MEIAAHRIIMMSIATVIIMTTIVVTAIIMTTVDVAAMTTNIATLRNGDDADCETQRIL
jgi:hypothetical protein